MSTNDHDSSATSVVDWSLYLQSVCMDNDHLTFPGTHFAMVGSRHFPIELIYTPLRARAKLNYTAAGLNTDLAEQQQPSLTELLRRHRCVYIDGAPGSGKTAFMRFVATMLARNDQDGYQDSATTGLPWRQLYLGLDPAWPVYVPILLRVTDVRPALEVLQHQNHRTLLDILDRFCSLRGLVVPRASWQQLLDQGRAWILFDGFDEIGDDRLSEVAVQFLRDISHNWPTCRIVVTSRSTAVWSPPINFHSATIEPLDTGQIGDLIGRWVAALVGRDPSISFMAELDCRREQLLAAVVSHPAIRDMACNPFMLTCFCASHWHDAAMPQGRYRAYRTVLDWLFTARTRLRAEAGQSEEVARRSLARLALTMLQTDQPVVDLASATAMIWRGLARHDSGSDEEELQRRGNVLLRFECLASGVVQEVESGRIRFRHVAFLQFLAALQLAWLGDGEDLDAVVRNHVSDPHWLEVLTLFAVLLLEHGGDKRVDRLLDRLSDLWSLRGSTDDPGVTRLLSSILQSLAVEGYTVPVHLTVLFRELPARLQVSEGVRSDTVDDDPIWTAAAGPGRIVLEQAIRTASLPGITDDGRIAAFRSALASQAVIGDPANAARAAFLLADALGRCGAWEGAIEACEKGLHHTRRCQVRSADRNKVATLYAEGLKLTADAFLHGSRYEDARLNYHQAIRRHAEVGNVRLAMRARVLLSTLLFQLGRNSEAAPHIDAIRLYVLAGHARAAELHDLERVLAFANGAKLQP